MWRARTRARCGRGTPTDAGLSLVEVLVAFVVLMIAMVPLGYVLTGTVSGATSARQREAALQLADSWMEILSNTSPPTDQNGSVLTGQITDPSTLVPSGVPIPKSTLAGTNFTVRATYTIQDVVNTAQSDLCTDGQPPSSAHPSVIQLQVTVTWDQGAQALADTTNIDYPQPGLQTEGFLAVQLTNDGQSDVIGNSAATRLQSIPVTITDTSTNTTLPTVYPDANGCVFAQVPAGEYTVALGQPQSGTPSDFHGYTGNPAFVDTTGATGQTSTNNLVTETAETAVQFNAFDEGITTSISYGGASAVDRGVECPGANALTCLTLGNGPSSATAAWGGGSSTWSTAALSNVTTLYQVACTSAGNPTCVGVGYGPSGGVILTTPSDLNGGSIKSDSVPSGVTNVTQVACPSADGCYAFGTTSSGPVLLAGKVGQTSPNQDSWAIVAPASTAFTSLSSIACPTTTTCEVSGAASVSSGPSSPVIAQLDGDPATLAPTFSAQTLPSTTTSVGELTCPSATECLATETGDSTSSTEPNILVGPSIVSGQPSAWFTEPTFPTGASSITGLSCTSTTCVAIGSAGGGPTVWTGDLTASPNDDWASATGVPSSVTSLSSVACGQPANGDTADCVLAATAPSLASSGQLLEGSLSAAGSWSWNFASLPSGTNPLYYVGVSCEVSPSASRSTCAAVGATAAGPMVVTSTGGPLGPWSLETPSSLSGATVTGIPLEIAPSSTSSWTTPVAAGQPSNATQLPNVLYPQPSGYSIAAGDCPAEATSYSVASLDAQPGGQASATVPLALLPLRVVNSFGVPLSGATVTLTATTSGCAGDSYTMPVTDSNGVTQTSVPYGTYSYTVTSSTGTKTSPSASLQLNSASSVTVGSGSPQYLPGPVTVPSS